MDSVIQFRNVSYWYPDSEKPALDNVTLDVGVGEFLLVVGSSGSGKSTLLRSINGLVPHFTGGRFSGDIVVCGLNTKKTAPRVLARCVGSVFQDPENQFIMSEVDSELAFGLENMGLGSAEIASRMREVSAYFGLNRFYGGRVHELSSGEKQLVVLASVLAMQPSVLVLDEPTSQLDPSSAAGFLYFLRRLNDEFSITIVLAEHRVDRVLSFVDRVFDLDSGVGGAPEDILPNSVNNPPLIHLSQKLREKNHDIGFPRSVKEAQETLKKKTIYFKPKTTLKPQKEMEAVASIQNLSLSLNGRRILNNVSLNLRRGEFTALMGLNGAGKTTLVKHLNGLLKAEDGSVNVLGLNVSEKTVEEMAGFVGFVSQNPNDYLFSETVLNELDFTAKNLGKKADFNALLTAVGIEQYKDAYPRDLSGGERQKIAIASVLAGNPEIIILDEPTRGMDAKSKQDLALLLKKLRSSGKTIVLVTHDVEFAASSSERVVILEEGKIVADGPTERILNESDLFRPQVSQVFHGKNYLTVEDALGGLT